MGVELEPHAVMVYANTAKGERVNLFPSGLIIYPKCLRLGCSPERKVYDSDVNNGQNSFGLLDTKVVKEGEILFDNVRYITKDNTTNQYFLKKTDIYYYQVQCQLGLTGLDWYDFFSYIDDNLFFLQKNCFWFNIFSGSKRQGGQFFLLNTYIDTLTVLQRTL